MDTELTLLVVVIGLLLATRYLLPDILQQAGYHLIRRREDKPDRQKLSMARWLLFGLAWRLAILLPSFEILLLILVWLFLPIGIVNNLVATILLWFYAFLLYALTCTVASAWLMRFPMGRYGLTLMKRPTDPPDASR
ncbi:MAG: hypothetical protein LRY61_02410 [Burkholderiaceae bacterium]|nr:hypothetical protein [Burkholderiaceae bacterium]